MASARRPTAEILMQLGRNQRTTHETHDDRSRYRPDVSCHENDVRKDLKAPKLPFVIADTGQLGAMTKGDMVELCEIQLSFGDPAKHPEFEGTVASVGTRGFARPVEQSPSDFDYHWNHNVGSHYLIGEAMERAMVELLGGKAEPLPYGNRPKPALTEAAAKPAGDPAAQTALDQEVVMKAAAAKPMGSMQ